MLACSFNAQALSASTINYIRGKAPYLTFNGGITKTDTVENLLGITLSDGTKITPTTNTSTTKNPIELPTIDQSSANIDMWVPSITDSISLNSLIGSPNNYWGDEDGDGQGEKGITVTGSLSVQIFDKYERIVNRSTIFSICNAPYKLVLSSTNGMLITQYGVPNSSSFNGSSATYYIKPKSLPIICYAKPSLEYGDGQLAGPIGEWDPKEGFIIQSTKPSSYNLNFPTAGANELYFDLDIKASKKLTWPTVMHGNIKATMIPNATGTSVRVTLTGPTVTSAQQQEDAPGLIDKPSVPQQFELVGYDGDGKAIVKYGFVLKKWFINRANHYLPASTQAAWCASLGYRQITLSDVTNAIGNNFTGAAPSSGGNHYQRRVGGGFFSEWGNMDKFTAAGFNHPYGGYWSSDISLPYQFTVNSNSGFVYDMYTPEHLDYGLCTYP